MNKLIFALTLFALTVTSIPALAQVTGEGPYRSDMKEQCNAELAKDAQWRAEIENDMRSAVHQDDANLMLRNKQHVVAAYAVIWGLVVIFLVLVWLRQRRLTGEIARLERDLEKAVKES